MSTDISFIQLVAHASWVVKFVLLILFLASLVSWTMIISKRVRLKRARDAADDFEDLFWSLEDLGPLYNKISAKNYETAGMERIFESGFKEFARLRKQNGITATAVMEGAQRAMRVALNREIEDLETNLSFLATVGSTSPYIGLFGTVWGIKHAFESIALQQNTNLAVVAPGIAEALFATAIGLVAAIPAVLAYNKLSTDLARVAARLEAFGAEFSAILSRQTEERG
jgi:biopolymer transport protein TolQ